MISIPRKARPRRSPNRVQLVEPDGLPARPSAESWPAWVDNHFWEPGLDAHDLAAHVTLPPVPEPDDDGRRDGAALWAEMMIEASLPPVETDAEFLARLGHEEQIERQRLANTYHPTAADLAEYGAYLASIGDGPEPYAVEPGHSFEDWEALRSGQVSSDELAQLAAHGCL